MPIPFRPALAATTTLVAASLLTPSPHAQCPPGAAMPRDVRLETFLPQQGPARTRVDTGLDALAAGDPTAARTHLLAALEFHPSSPEILFAIVRTCADDADLMAMWLERFVRASTDTRGRFKPDRETARSLRAIKTATPLLKPSQELTARRVAAIKELARFAQRQKPSGRGTAERALLVRWASEALLTVGRGAPQPLAEVAAKIEQQQRAFEPDYEAVYAALARVMRQKVPASEDGAPITGPDGDPERIADRRIRAARILAGLGRQVAFKDLEGPRPNGPGELAVEARKLLEADRERAIAQGRVWTIAELEAMSTSQRLAFTEEHRHWHHPGIALSATGRYRIETICGHETLLGTAKTIELHHERLVGHYGKDPFVGRPGVVRIVPEKGDMDTEGAPFWWAGGFQAGDRTTVRFAWSNLVALGRTLTHELTHRFDGVLRPFLPAWYVEGHADWTGNHYARMTDKVFAENFLRVGTAAHTFYRGYGGKKKLAQLLTGEIEDYRDNYFAGYSLYTFLKTWPPGEAKYAPALAKFERNARAGRNDPLGYFTKTFCDGKQGRPADFDGFHAEWQSFVKGCYDWTDPRRRNADNRWVALYGGRGKGEGASKVKDEPTWSWGRTPAEPFYGQQHAAAATLLLHEVGDDDGTIAAGVWSLTADGWRPETARAVAAALARSGNRDAALAFAAIAHRRFPELAVADATPLLARLPKTNALLQALEQRGVQLAAENKPQASAALLREHAAIGRLFGLSAHPQVANDATPQLPRHLGAAGFTESKLTGFEERRREGLWYVTPEGDLHVGREKPRDATGVLDRRAHQRDAYAHSVHWIEPGHYVVRGRLHWTTSFVSGAIVLGHTRRDRGIRIGFSAGDFAFATGRREVNEGKGRARVNIGGLWERDGNLPDTGRSATVELPEEQYWFAFALHVRGARVEVLINDEPTLTYTVHDGTPIEGQVGFAVRQGAIRVQQPTVQRFDDLSGACMIGLDVSAQPNGTLGDLLQLRTRGLPVHEDGTLVLWLPKVDDGSPADRIGAAIRALSGILGEPLEYPQPWALAVPEGMDKEEIARVVDEVRAFRPGELPVVTHRVGAPFDGRRAWVLFVDGQGILRAAAKVTSTRLHTKVARWSRLFRGR